jgi:hypothetical protein
MSSLAMPTHKLYVNWSTTPQAYASRTTKTFLAKFVFLATLRSRSLGGQPPNQSTSFLHRIHIDIIGPLTPVGLNGEQYWIIYTDNYTRYQWIDVVDCKQVIPATLVRFLDRMETQHGVRVAICHLDNHTALINKDTRGQLARPCTVFEPSTPYTAHQNAVAESSNRMTETRSCNMLIAVPHLPKALWSYAARYAVELLNYYPTTAVPCGKTPRQMLLEHMKVVNPVPSLHSVRTFGEPGYVHTPVQKRIQSAKFQPRATKMYFVGREGSRIYHMWDSATGKVHRSSSVTWAKHGLVKLPQASRNELSQAMRNDIPYTQRHSIPLFEPALQLLPTPPYTPTNQDNQESGSGAAQQPGGEEVIEDKSQLPELGSGFEFDGLAEGSSFNFDRSIDGNTDNSLQALTDARALPPCSSPPIHNEAPRHLDISASVESRNILQGKRMRNR